MKNNCNCAKLYDKKPKIYAKKTLVLLMLFFVLGLVFSVAVIQAEDNVKKEIEKQLEQSVEKELEGIDLSELEEYLDKLEGDEKKLFEGSFREVIAKVIDGEYQVDAKSVFKLMFVALGGQAVSYLPLILTIVAIAIVFSIVDGLSSGFLNSNTKEIIYFVCYATIIVLLVGNVMVLVNSTKEVVERMQSLMQAIFPLLMTMLVSLGGVASGATFQPLMSTLAVSVTGIITKFILPLFIATIVFTIVGNLSKGIKLDKLTKFFKSLAEFVLGLIFSVFITLLTVQGMVGSTIDSISVKSAKFALSSYVPILGGYLTDGFDLIFASCVLIKNAVGFCGILLILSIILLPVIQIFIFSLALKLTSGLIEPICDKRMSELVYKISKNVSLLVAIILGVAFLFFVLILFVMSALNVGGV